MPEETPSNETILQEAGRIVDGGRQDDYGHPREDFGRTARLWSVILDHPVRPSEVGMCMIALKVARQCHRHNRDNLVDIAGYARTLEVLAGRQGPELAADAIEEFPEAVEGDF